MVLLRSILLASTTVNSSHSYADVVKYPQYNWEKDMEANQTQKTVFCCPHHGVLQESVEYTSAIIESKRLINIPVMRCPECNEYYTPFTNLLALGSLRYNGKQIRASKGRAEKAIPRIEVLRPSFVDIDCVATQEAKGIKEQDKLEVRIMPDLTKLTKPEIEYLCKQMPPRIFGHIFRSFQRILHVFALDLDQPLYLMKMQSV